MNITGTGGTWRINESVATPVVEKPTLENVLGDIQEALGEVSDVGIMLVTLKEQLDSLLSRLQQVQANTSQPELSL